MPSVSSTVLSTPLSDKTAPYRPHIVFPHLTCPTTRFALIKPRNFPLLHKAYYDYYK
jgi:hypothetical protein